ncbi:MAG TPA: serine hydrolase domain-containing protein [Gemmatimonadales bacterium]
MPHAKPVASSIGAYADSLFRAYADSNGPGASVIVLQRGQVVFWKSYGEASLEEGRAATPTTNYRLASVTKEFTAMATLLVAQDGGLRLDDSIAKFFPELPPRLQAITVRNLLTHTSGLLDYEDFIPDTQTVQVHDSDVLAILSAYDSVNFQPGERWQYSNSGYAMLALIVQKQSGMRFADFLAERIFKPLGMTRTVAFENGISTVAERAYGYSRREGNGGWVQSDQSNTSAVLGDGGIYTSIDDLTHWAAALDAGKLVRSDLLQQAFTAYTLKDGTSAKYGFGWYVGPFENLPSTWHTGETRGFRNAIRRLPTEGITIIALTNRNEGEPIQLVDSLAKRMLDNARP